MPTLAEIGNLKGHSNAITRWAKFGPYYAMFPIDFAFEVVAKYSKAGDYIIDPFAGRCSSIYAGGVLDRNSLGIEINPLGWLYGTVKLNPASKSQIIDKLCDVYEKRNDYKRPAARLSEFFKLCYCKEVLLFLLSARDNLRNWQNDYVEATLMSIILVHLHGKLGEGLSNQMRQTKAMGWNYSINWWKAHEMTSPPQYDPFDFLMKKIEWRYTKGTPAIKTKCKIILGDSTTELEEIIKESRKKRINYSLLFTSPPYYSVTDYHVDQWLRLWLLGGEGKPKTNPDKYRGRFNSREEYSELLLSVFSKCAELMGNKSIIFVRTDAREFTYDITLEILKECFPKYKSKIQKRPFKGRTQTDLFNKNNKKYGEFDIILSRK
ncbi:MAG: DNA modification methylase [Thiotrichaceae bacterium IS1]|nr:MAG: DNA modification methylase [Thiotrichaceae bacterium IS1]